MIQVQEQLNELAHELYQMEGRRIRPLYPWVLVRVLPKQQRVGGIDLPQIQNKIFYEGIVLETWSPFWKTFRKGATEDDDETEVFIQSQLQIGDHVMFPHYEGIPDAVQGLPEDYRLVREVNKQDPKCEVMAKLEYDQSVRERLQEWLYDRSLMTFELHAKLGKFLEEFHVIPKDQTYKTISGK